MIRREYIRFVRRNPVGTVLLVLLLAIGFTGSAATYTIIRLLLAPRSGGLRQQAYVSIAEKASGGVHPVSWQTYERLRETAASSGLRLAAYAEPITVHLSSGQNEEEISVAAASNGFFGAFTQGLNGEQDFSFSWQGRYGGTEIVLSQSLAERLFANAEEAVGRNLSLNNQTFHIIGIAPRGFSGLWSPADAWVTPDKMSSLAFGVVSSDASKNSSGSENTLWEKSPVFYVLAGSTVFSQSILHQQLEKIIRLPENTQSNLGASDGLTKDPVWDSKVRAWARLALLLSAALIFATALNYCGLLLAQAPRHVEELRLKKVLGAGVLRILLENMCGPVITVLVGFLVAAGATTAVLSALGKRQLHSLMAGGISWKMAAETLGTGLAIACVLAVLVALLPALRLLHDSGAPQLGYTSTSGKKMNFILYGIVSSQIASCIVICLVAGMILGAVRSLSREALGFQADRLSVFAVSSAAKGGTFSFTTSDANDFPLAVFTRGVVTSPANGVSAAGSLAAASCAPFAQPLKTISIQRLDRGLPPLTVHFCAVSREFFRTTGNPIIEGSAFSDDSFTGEVHELIVNRKLASELWPQENALHRSVLIEEPSWGIRFTSDVIGVAQDMRFSGLANTPDATVFLPLKGNVFSLSFPLYFLTRDTASLHPVEESIERQARGSRLALGVSNSYQVKEPLTKSLMEQQARVWLSAGGAMLVALIAYLGLYGVLIHSVNSRRKEIAIRSCFGASNGSVRLLILRKALQCSVTAIALSSVAWQPVKLLLSGAWTGKMELSWPLMIAIPLLCLGAAVAISFKPAWDATRVPPSELLKGQ
jgi:hypothetical protein